jgi:hypothetical protein
MIKWNKLNKYWRRHWSSSITHCNYQVSCVVLTFLFTEPFSVEDVHHIVDGHFGAPVNVDLLLHCAQSLGVDFNYDAYMQSREEVRYSLFWCGIHVRIVQINAGIDAVTSASYRRALDLYHLEQLTAEGIPATDDSFKYSLPDSNQGEMTWVSYACLKVWFQLTNLNLQRRWKY